MKYLQTINEYQRTVGFRYSEPKESYNVALLLKGEDITLDKIVFGLSKVNELVYDTESIEVNILDEETIVELENVSVQIDAVVDFNITVYNEREIITIVEELGKKLLPAFNIEILDFKSKENLAGYTVTKPLITDFKFGKNDPDTNSDINIL
jgi:hypothetical protein